MPRRLYEVRLKDHESFYCPNGHARHFVGQTEEQKRIEKLERWNGMLQEEHCEMYAQRENLIAALKECPLPGCVWHSRKQIPRDPVNMGRGIERVRADLLQHFIHIHSYRPALLELTA